MIELAGRVVELVWGVILVVLQRLLGLVRVLVTVVVVGHDGSQSQWVVVV